MSFETAFQDVADYLWKEYPAYAGWRIRSFAWDYDLSHLPSEIFHDLSDKFEANDKITMDDVKAHVERVQPPEGFAYVTLQKDKVRVGFNVPAHVFRKESA